MRITKRRKDGVVQSYNAIRLFYYSPFSYFWVLPPSYTRKTSQFQITKLGEDRLDELRDIATEHEKLLLRGVYDRKKNNLSQSDLDIFEVISDKYPVKKAPEVFGWWITYMEPTHSNRQHREDKWNWGDISVTPSKKGGYNVTMKMSKNRKVTYQKHWFGTNGQAHAKAMQLVYSHKWSKPGRAPR